MQNYNFFFEDDVFLSLFYTFAPNYFVQKKTSTIKPTQ